MPKKYAYWLPAVIKRGNISTAYGHWAVYLFFSGKVLHFFQSFVVVSSDRNMFLYYQGCRQEKYNLNVFQYPASADITCCTISIGNYELLLKSLSPPWPAVVYWPCGFWAPQWSNSMLDVLVHYKTPNNHSHTTHPPESPSCRTRLVADWGEKQHVSCLCEMQSQMFSNV